MKSPYPELALERIVIALERDIIDATDEEVMMAAHELGMNPSMKGSSAFFGVTRLLIPQSESREKISRAMVSSRLAVLSPPEVKALLTWFGNAEPERAGDEEDPILCALVRDLALLQKKQ